MNSGHFRTILLFAVPLLAAMVLPSAMNRVPLAAAQDRPPLLSDLSWMAGDWETRGGRRQVEEHWTRPAGGSMLGMSRAVQDEKTVEFEFLRIERRADGIYYVAQPGGRPGVDFKLGSLRGQEAVFENAGHADHLKKIIYRKNSDGSLTARIEGEEKGQPFSQEWQYWPQPR